MLITFSSQSSYALSSCKLDQNSKSEIALVKWVYDGDTLLVTDKNGKNKRKIRIIGIDTPEVKHHKQKAQLFGASAREELRVLLNRVNYQIVLEYDADRYDKYKRTLAHVYLTNGINLSEWLLQQGFAKTLTITPNVKHAKCYKSTERLAQKKQLKLWNLKSNRVKTPQDLKTRSKGYIRLQAKVTQIKQQKKSLILVLEDKINEPIQVRIKKRNLQYFKSINPKKLVTQEVIVSGILKNKKGKRTITLNHESQIELLHASNTSNTSIEPSIKWSSKK